MEIGNMNKNEGINGLRANDIFRKGNRSISGKYYIRCMNNHILVNYDLYNDIDLKDIKRCHRVHLFMNHTFIDKNSYRRFIIKCFEITCKRVIIHVPYNEGSSSLVEELTFWDPDTNENFSRFCKIKEEKRRNTHFKFAYNRYLQVWNSPLENKYCATMVWDNFGFCKKGEENEKYGSNK